jgi:hypothetical protein
MRNQQQQRPQGVTVVLVAWRREDVSIAVLFVFSSVPKG